MLKRGFDLIAAGGALILLAPLLVIIAVLVKLDTPGPAFYLARRVGRGGRLFRMYKFRTMVVDADRVGPGLTYHHDPRVTRVGRFLRRARLDELPQLVNVIRGEMSLVGPRPETPEYVDLSNPIWQRVLSIPPGIAGLTQITYASEASLLREATVSHDYLTHILPGKLALDLHYVETRSLQLDLQLLLRTLQVAFLRCPV
jgi:lipopolysaccharide/colanic/teichoic acid biosynthesis glycosyltransferase